MLKHGVKVLCPELTDIFSALYGCLSKHSMHKKRVFEGLEEIVGLEIKKVPKFIDVRFRVIQRCCLWLESQDRAVYQYFSEMKEKIMAGKYEASKTEMIVVEKYKGNYLEVKLASLFIIDVSKPVMDLISFFESNKIRIHDKQGKLVILLYDYLSKYLKQAGLEGNNNPTGEQLLKVKYKDTNIQLSNKDIYLGSRVETLLRKLGISRDSTEINPFITKVRCFYIATVEKMFKYFSGCIKSSTLRALSVLSPNSWTDADLDHLKKSWRKLAQAFPNIVKVEEIPNLLVEVSSLKMAAWGWREVDRDSQNTNMPVDEFFKMLSKMVDDDGAPAYPLLVWVGYALATIYNSSSPAERDFSLLNAFLADPHRNKTSQRLLLAKMHVKAECLSLTRQCRKCQEIAKKGQKSSHCHCDQWKPSEKLMETMRNGGPYQRYEADRKIVEQEEKDKEVLKEVLKKEDELKEADDFNEELELMRKRNKKKELKEAGRMREEAKKKNKDKKKKESAKEKKKKNGKKVPSRAEMRRREQRSRLTD